MEKLIIVAIGILFLVIGCDDNRNLDQHKSRDQLMQETIELKIPDNISKLLAIEIFEGEILSKEFKENQENARKVIFWLEYE